MECDDDIVILIVDDINMTLHTKVDNDIDTSLQTKVDNDNDTLLHTKEEPAGDDILYQNPGNLNSEIETSVKVEAVDEETITDQENFYVDNANDTVYLPEHEDHEKNEVQEEYEIQEKHEIHEEHEVQEEFEEHEVNCEKPVPKTKSRMLKPSERVSYVKCWKSTYPELKDDKELLLDCLVAVMNEIKPPPPPTDYYSLDGIMLKCIHCDHQSATIPKATRHYQETHGERYLHCLACGVNFRRRIQCDHQSATIPKATRHYQETHGERYLHCLACGVNFRRRIQCDHQSATIPKATRHYQETHGERYLHCLACGVNFRRRIQCDHQSATIPKATRHYQETHGERYLHCLACGDNFRRRIQCDHQSATIPKATRHYQETHGERYLHCLACGVNFRRRRTARGTCTAWLAATTSEGELSLALQLVSRRIQCDHQSATIPKATRHYQETHGERYLHCLACGVNFRSKTTLYKHEKTCIAPDAVTVLKARARQLGDKARSRPFLCKPKKKTPKMFPCTDCPAIFKVRSGLTAHQRTHTGQRPYVCWQCLKAYTSNTALRRHEKLHTSQRFECAHCARIFRTRALITAHLDTHLPQKRFACAECSRRYAQRFALQLHVDRVHRGLPPPFACQLCPKRFARLSILKEHMQKAHGLDIVTRKV
ncbi:oocyte zinc finger protein XlCOF6 [Bicyclus anynana]|uniref:Oocyte zinc finger protein XlCOF6 n=1 Tax=Bicyclus anynana TaxID=110368 RepID=A0ABM3LR13_BICAN|nr:oocyte zinc finger protein XlCOF6 [Bicyclus anynana]